MIDGITISDFGQPPSSPHDKSYGLGLFEALNRFACSAHRMLLEKLWGCVTCADCRFPVSLSRKMKRIASVGRSSSCSNHG